MSEASRYGSRVGAADGKSLLYHPREGSVPPATENGAQSTPAQSAQGSKAAQSKQPPPSASQDTKKPPTETD